MINNICFSGGGLKGGAYIGVLRYLEEYDMLKNIHSYSGTSIGSVYSLCMILGYSSKELEKMYTDLDYSLLEDININFLISKKGLLSTKKIEYFLKRIIVKKGYDENISFENLFKNTGKTLYVETCRIRDNSSYSFNKNNTPEFPVYKACLYSINVPLLFIEQDGFIDGCFSKNIPLDVFSSENTVGFYVITNCTENKVDTLFSYINTVIGCIMIKSSMAECKNHTKNGYSIIYITTEIGSLDVNASNEIKIEAITAGYDACKNNKLHEK